MDIRSPSLTFGECLFFRGWPVSAAFFERPVWEQTIGKQSNERPSQKNPAVPEARLRGTSNTRHPSHLHYRFALATANFQHSASFALEVRFRSRSPLTLRHREAFRSKRGFSFRVYATLRPIAVPVIARWVWVATNGPIRAICFPAHLALPPLTAVKLSRDVFKSRRRFLSTRKGKRIE